MDQPWLPITTANVPDNLDPETRLKVQWAGLIATAADNHQERYKAARRLFPRADQEGLCQHVASVTGWINDPVVMGEIARIKREATGDDLPNKEAIARSLLNIAEDKLIPIDDRLKAYKQYCTLMGLDPGSGKGAGVQVNVDARRMFVTPAPLSDDSWQDRAREIRARQIEASVNSDA